MLPPHDDPQETATQFNPVPIELHDVPGAGQGVGVGVGVGAQTFIEQLVQYH